jgi:hypothetical protein
VKAVPDAPDQLVERLFVAAHRPLDEPSLHPSASSQSDPHVGSITEYE